MRFDPNYRSSNVEDRRGTRLSMGRGMGLGGTVVLLVLSLIFGRNLLDLGGTAAAPVEETSTGTVQETPAEHERVGLVSTVLDDANAVWARVLPQYGTEYRPAHLVLFRDAVRSGCGTAESAMGPFYCPLDERVYIDLNFYDELHRQFGAPGDFAQAYVLAHEVGHHVQHLIGTDQRVRQLQERNPREANQLSVSLELQADCYAGVWAKSTEQRRLLDVGDVQEALGAAAAVGDDRIQRQMTGSIQPESFTHGSAEQRMQWFRRGFESGSPEACNTFQG